MLDQTPEVTYTNLCIDINGSDVLTSYDRDLYYILCIVDEPCIQNIVKTLLLNEKLNTVNIMLVRIPLSDTKLAYLRHYNNLLTTSLALQHKNLAWDGSIIIS